MNACEQVAIDNVVRIAVHDGLLVSVGSTRLGRGDECGANVAKVCTHGLGGQYCATC